MPKVGRFQLQERDGNDLDLRSALSKTRAAQHEDRIHRNSGINRNHVYGDSRRPQSAYLSSGEPRVSVKRVLDRDWTSFGYE